MAIDTIVNAANRSLLGGGGVTEQFTAQPDPAFSRLAKNLIAAKPGMSKLQKDLI